MIDAPNTHVLSALVDKRARLAGEVAALRGQLAKRQEQLIHLDATLRLFDAAYKELRL